MSSSAIAGPRSAAAYSGVNKQPATRGGAAWLGLIALTLSACSQPNPNLPSVPSATVTHEQGVCDLLRQIKAEVEGARSTNLYRLDRILDRALGVRLKEAGAFRCEGVKLSPYDNGTRFVYTFDVEVLTVGLGVHKASGEITHRWVTGK